MFTTMRAWLRGKRTQRSQRQVPNRWRPVLEQLESRELMSATVTLRPRNFDFGTSTSPIASGYIQALPTAYDSTTGYGWTAASGLGAVDQGGTNPLLRDFASGRDATFVVNVPNGPYTVVVTLGLLRGRYAHARLSTVFS